MTPRSPRILRLVATLALFMLAACQATPSPAAIYPTATTQFIPNFPTASATSAGSNTPSPAPTTAPIVSPAPSPPPTAKISEGGSIMVGGIGEPSFEVTSLPRFVSEALYDSLLEFDPADATPRPGLAQAWEFSPDARTLTFHLRANVRWHNGSPLTAADVVFTITTLSNPRSRLTPAADFGPLDTVTAPDAQTVKLMFKSPDCAALAQLGALKILPRQVLDKQNLAQLTPKQLVGSGPLKFVDYKPGVGLTFTRNPDYWQGAPHITDWTYKIFSGATALAAAAASGQVDVIEYDTARGDVPQAASGWRVYGHPANGFLALSFNLANSVLADARIRQAMDLALDRDALIQELVRGRGVPLDTSYLPSFWAAPEASPARRYDPARARQLFADAGWKPGANGELLKDGKPLALSLWSLADDPLREPLAVGVREMLGAAGVRAQLMLDDRGNWLNRVFAHDFDLALVQWNLPLDPDQTLLWQSKQNDPGNGFNIGSYANPRVDDWLQQGLAVPSCDPKARQAIYAQMTQQLSADTSNAFLFSAERGLLARTAVGGLQPSPFAGEYWNLPAWFITK